jgi:predicted metal-dependent hydrolase
VFWLLFGRPGFLRAALPPLLAYYRPGYTGQRAADAVLVERGRAALAAEVGAELASGAARMPARAAA